MDQTMTWQTVQACPAHDRLAFAVRLWDQLVADGWQPQPSDDLAAELDRRLAAHEADPTNVRTWEQVMERIRGQEWNCQNSPTTDRR